MIMWPDNETATDLLGFQVHSDLIKSVVTDPNVLPVTLGIFGDWGGGKSSVMKMLQQELAEPEDSGVICLSFNGWMFEGYDDAKSALISSVLLQMGEHKRFGPRIRDRIVPVLSTNSSVPPKRSHGRPTTTAGLTLQIRHLAHRHEEHFAEGSPGFGHA